MRRIIALFCICILLFGIFPNVIVFANSYIHADEDKYDVNAYHSEIWERYGVLGDRLWIAQSTDEYYSFVNLVNATCDDAWLDFGVNLAEEELTKMRYVEILVNLMALMDVNTQEMIKNQAKADTLKTLDDYFLDATEILVEGISVSAAFGTGVTAPMKSIASTMDLTWDAAEVTINSIEVLEYVNRVQKNYAAYTAFLAAVVENADDSALQSAANTLSTLAGKAFYCKVDAVISQSDATSKYLGKEVFFDTILLEDMLEDASILKLSSEDMTIIKQYKTVYDFLGVLEFSQDVAVFISDIVGGFSDCMNRYSEMRVLCGIRKALLSEIGQLRGNIKDVNDAEIIGNVCDLLRCVLYVNYRGEYCFHEMVTTDGDIFSISITKNGKETSYDELFEFRKSKTETYSQWLDVIIPEIELYKKTDDNSIEGNSAVKQLTKIIRYDKYTDSAGYSYELSYNDKNQLVELVQGLTSSENKHSPTFTYSPEGKLLWIITGEPTDAYAPGYNSGCGYEYNSSGQLIKDFAWEGGYGETTYKYDSAGKCVGSVENGDFYTTTETYVYGTDGLRLYSEVDTAFSDGSTEHYIVEYDYSYKPFVLKHQKNTEWKYLVFPIDDNISVLNFFFSTDVQFYTNEEGYLEKAATESETYHFYYATGTEQDASSPNTDAEPNAPDDSELAQGFVGNQTADQLRKSIVGSWGTIGSISSNYDFNSDGTCCGWLDKQTEGTYKILDNKTLIVSFPWSNNQYFWTEESFDEWRSHSSEDFWYMADSGELLLNGISYYRYSDGKVNIDYNTEGDLLAKIAGAWVSDNNLEYRFFTDGTYEENTVFVHSGLLIFRETFETGPIEIIDDTHAKLWNEAESFSEIPFYTALEYDSQTDTLYIGGSNNVYHRAKYSD